MNTNIKSITIWLLLFGLPIIINAQDVLIKTDKSELKAKVIELTETTIKYKRWDNQTGPIYNINKADVFMIIYANGQREIIKQQTNSTPSTAATNNYSLNTSTNNSIASQIETSSSAAIDTSIDYKTLKVKYSPSRLLYWFQNPPTTIGIQQEIRIVKNVLNFGVGTDFFFVNDVSETLYSIYMAPYLPINRLSGNYANQDKGLFINGKIGYASLSVTYNGKSSSSGGVLLGVGADYMVTKWFGLSLAGFKYAESDFLFQGGICITVL